MIEEVKSGTALKITPKREVINIAKRCHAWSSSPSGVGENQIAQPISNTSSCR
jgi:hypothetical protein